MKGSTKVKSKTGTSLKRKSRINDGQAPTEELNKYWTQSAAALEPDYNAAYSFSVIPVGEVWPPLTRPAYIFEAAGSITDYALPITRKVVHVQVFKIKIIRHNGFYLTAVPGHHGDVGRTDVLFRLGSFRKFEGRFAALQTFVLLEVGRATRLFLPYYNNNMLRCYRSPGSQSADIGYNTFASRAFERGHYDNPLLYILNQAQPPVEDGSNDTL